MDPIRQWWVEEKAKKVVEKLVAHDFEAVYARTKEEAVQELWKHITPKQKIGVGGSLTIRGLGILEKLEAQGYTIYDHWKSGLSKENILEIRKLQMTSDLFLTSANAITLNGFRSIIPIAHAFACSAAARVAEDEPLCAGQSRLTAAAQALNQFASW